MTEVDDRVYGVVHGKLIARKRTLTGLTQGELAGLVEVRQSTISRIEAGQLPDALTQRRIADALGTTVDELHALTLEGMQRVEAAAEGALHQDEVRWGPLVATVGLVALAGLALFVAVSLVPDPEEE